MRFRNKDKILVEIITHVKIIELFTCRRKTNRWTINTFFYIIDVCAYNAYVLHKIRYPNFYIDDNLRARMLSLETLAMELINPGIKARNEKLSKNNYQGIQGSKKFQIRMIT